MSGRAALCIDDASRIDPSYIGLSGENLESQSWLEVFPDGEEARKSIAQDENIERVWVVSCDDVEPINLAATLKEDRPDLFVSLVHREACGSVLSRAHNANIDEVLDMGTFVRSYSEMKGRNAVIKPALVEAQVVETARPKLAAHASPVQREEIAQTLEEQKSEPVRVLARSVLQTSTFVMPIVSGSGGAGKSVVSVIGAYVAHEMGYRTLLLDYDLQFGDAALLSGVKDPVFIDEAFAHPDLVDREIERCSGLGAGSSAGPVVLAAPERLETAELVVRALPEHFDLIAAKFDVVIANTGAAWAEQHAALLERSNAALFLVDQRASSIRACKHALELCARCGIATGPFKFAVNRCAKGAPLTSIDVSCALRGVPVFELKDGGADVEELLGAGSPAELLKMRNEFCVSLEQLLAKVLPDGERRKDSLELPVADREEKRRGRHAGRRWGRRKS